MAPLFVELHQMSPRGWRPCRRSPGRATHCRLERLVVVCLWSTQTRGWWMGVLDGMASVVVVDGMASAAEGILVGSEADHGVMVVR